MNLKSTNEEEKKNTCSVCHKKFKHVNALKRHENAHVNVSKIVNKPQIYII